MFLEYIGTIIIKEASCQKSKKYWPVLEKSGFQEKVDDDGHGRRWLDDGMHATVKTMTLNWPLDVMKRKMSWCRLNTISCICVCFLSYHAPFMMHLDDMGLIFKGHPKKKILNWKIIYVFLIDFGHNMFGLWNIASGKLNDLQL